MDAVQIIEQSLDHATGLVRQVRVHHLNAQTPCSEWDVRALLNHMMNELAWEPDMLAGRTVAEVGTSHERDYTGGDVVSRWEEYAFIAVERAKRADVDSTVHLSYGDVPARHYLAELGSDMLVHAWDLGQGLQCSLIMDRDLAQAVYENSVPREAEFRSSGLFGPVVAVAEDADIQTKLLAFYGRNSTKI